MSITEKDPRDIAYVALYIAQQWYKQLEPEAAIRLAKGRSMAKPGRKLTPEVMEQINKIIESQNFRNFNSIEKKFRINRYDVISDKGEFDLSQIDVNIKKIKNISTNCDAADCQKCILNKIMSGDLTLCEVLGDIETDKNGKLVIVENSRVYRKFTKSLLSGEKKTMCFKVYSSAAHELEKFIEQNKGEKIQDIISLALLEYTERHK